MPHGKDISLLLSFALGISLVLVGYVMKANFPLWSGKQWHFWAMGVFVAVIFYCATLSLNRPG